MSDEQKYSDQNVDSVIVEGTVTESIIVEDVNGDGIVDGVAMSVIETSAVAVDGDSDGEVDGVALEIVEVEYTAVDTDYDGVVDGVVVGAEVTTVVAENEYASSDEFDYDDNNDEDVS